MFRINNIIKNAKTYRTTNDNAKNDIPVVTKERKMTMKCVYKKMRE